LRAGGGALRPGAWAVAAAAVTHTVMAMTAAPMVRRPRVIRRVTLSRRLPGPAR
jgi:hypothetical protein